MLKPCAPEGKGIEYFGHVRSKYRTRSDMTFCAENCWVKHWPQIKRQGRSRKLDGSLSKSTYAEVSDATKLHYDHLWQAQTCRRGLEIGG
jgi:hypothetical protein